MIAAKRHGLTKHPLFKIWSGMMGRCYCPTDPAFKYYGGRGIFICAKWKYSFILFYTWAISNGWKRGLTIERVKNSGPYSPVNCKMATRKEQARNRRSNVIISFRGQSLSVIEWAEKLAIPAPTIYNRILRGVPENRLLLPSKKLIKLTINEQIKTITQWATHFGLPKETVAERYRKGVRGDKLFFKGNMRSYHPLTGTELNYSLPFNLKHKP